MAAAFDGWVTGAITVLTRTVGRRSTDACIQAVVVGSACSTRSWKIQKRGEESCGRWMPNANNLKHAVLDDGRSRGLPPAPALRTPALSMGLAPSGWRSYPIRPSLAHGARSEPLVSNLPSQTRQRRKWIVSNSAKSHVARWPLLPQCWRQHALLRLRAKVNA